MWNWDLIYNLLIVKIWLIKLLFFHLLRHFILPIPDGAEMKKNHRTYTLLLTTTLTVDFSQHKIDYYKQEFNSFSSATRKPFHWTYMWKFIVNGMENQMWFKNYSHFKICVWTSVCPVSGMLDWTIWCYELC